MAHMYACICLQVLILALLDLSISQRNTTTTDQASISFTTTDKLETRTTDPGSTFKASTDKLETRTTDQVSTFKAATDKLDTNTAELNNNETTTLATSEAEKCHFETTDSNVRDKLSEALKSSTKLVKFTIRFVNISDAATKTDYYPQDILNSNDGNLFRPYHWTRSTNMEGITLLNLDSNFEVLSLSLLGIGIESMDVDLMDIPRGCITDLTADDRVREVRRLLLNDFKVAGTGNGAGSLGKNERICNQRIETENRKATFRYECCHTDPDGNMICEFIQKDLWITVLLVSVLVIKVFVALYSPSFLPDTYYREKYTGVEYVHQFPEGKDKKTVRIVKTMNPEYYRSENPPVRMENLKEHERLKSTVECMHTDEIHDMKLERIHFTVQSRKLLSEDYVPVSVVRMINDNFFRCGIRNIPALKPCCYTGICAPVNQGWRVVTWFSCLRVFAKLLLIGIFAMPWFIRLIIYYLYEAEIVEEMKNAATERNADLSFKGSFTLYLTPVHPLYIVVYVVVALVALVYGFMGTDMKTRLRLTLRKCLRDMRERSRTEVYEWAIGWLFVPFTRCGLFGILIVPLYWPLLFVIMIPVFAFSTLPTLNLSLRFIVHPFGLICQKCLIGRLPVSKTPNIKETFQRRRIGKEVLFKLKEDLTRKEICLQSFVILGCLMSFWSLTFLLMECLSFFVEVAVYTLMGIIVNASATLRYVTLFFLVWVYAKDSLVGVHKLYLSYNKIIWDQLVSGKREEMMKVAKQDDSVQEDAAFRVQSSFNAADLSSGVKLEVKNGALSWRTSGLLVFLNNKDKPFTPLKFFFESNELDCYGVPGPLWKNTLAAFCSLMKMVIFLFFVVAVVLAFGNQFSSTNQLLAILAGGFLPFAFRNFLKRGSGGANVSTSSVRFVTEFDKLVAGYTQKWPVSDIIPKEETVKDVVPLKDAIPTAETTSGGSGTGKDVSGDNIAEPGLSGDVALDIETEIADTSVDLIVQVSSAEKMSHLVKSCVRADVNSVGEEPVVIRTSASFSNPMYSHTGD